MAPATPPPVGRQPRIATISGRTYRIKQLTPRHAFRLGVRVTGILGDPIAALFSGAGLEIPGMTDDDGQPLRIGWGAVLHSSVAREALLAKALGALTQMRPEDADMFVDELLVGQVEVQEGQAWIGIINGDMLDAYIGDTFDLLMLLKEAFTATYFPTTAGGATSDKSSADGTSESPAAT